MKTVFMFSGMGSQSWQMGLALYRQDECFRRHADELDALCRRRVGESVLSRIYDSAHRPYDSMDDSVFSALAIFVVEQALAKTLISRGLEPDLLLSSSLGLFASATLAGCLDESEALQAVVTQAQIFEHFCNDGTMIAVLAPVSQGRADPVLGELAEIGAINFDSNYVLSVPATHWEPVENRLRELNLGFQRIQVRRAFHSRWVEAAHAPFLGHFQCMDYRRARIPVLCCSREDARLTLGADEFWAAVREPIQLQRAVLRLEQAEPWLYVDVGPSGTLATCLKYLLQASSSSRAFTVMASLGDDLDRLRLVLSQAETLLSA